MTPVVVLTGFLGSGKTTLLRELLRDPAIGRTAVIINEFGAVGLDHELIETSDEDFVQLSTGCLCCQVRSDLVLTLSDLAARRQAGSVPPFERVVIETTGLADPAPILHALMTDRDLGEIYGIRSVIATVDAVTGIASLDRHDESLRQAALADVLIITKSDLPEAQCDALRERLCAMNPGARMLEVVHGKIRADVLFGGSDDPNASATATMTRLNALTPSPHAPQHSAGITSFCIVRDDPVKAVTLSLLLSALAENCGRDLLRLKGIVAIEEDPARPALVNGVQHVYHAPVWLERWPSDDRRTRMVFIGCGIRESWVRSLLELLELEVADEQRSIRRRA